MERLQATPLPQDIIDAMEAMESISRYPDSRRVISAAGAEGWPAVGTVAVDETKSDHVF